MLTRSFLFSPLVFSSLASSVVELIREEQVIVCIFSPKIPQKACIFPPFMAHFSRGEEYKNGNNKCLSWSSGKSASSFEGGTSKRMEQDRSSHPFKRNQSKEQGKKQDAFGA